MPRFLIERTYTVDVEELATIVGTRAAAIGHRFPEIVWEHSHVVLAESGTPKSFCVYSAPNEAMVRHHSSTLGHHFIDAIYEIAGDVTPDDFPLAD